MSYIPSVNIEHNSTADFNYIVTENARIVTAEIINGFNSGFHAFTLVGTYGTGKSSYLLALEENLVSHSSNLIANRNIFGNSPDYEFMNIVGDYSSLSSLIAKKLSASEPEILQALNNYYQKLKKQNKFLFIVVDEFGKILEHAAKTNPEKELYFLQKLAEFINVPSRKIILLTTLHQNFGTYSSGLSLQQREEWQKVKGRFHEVVFAEPIEQLLYLSAQQLEGRVAILTNKQKNEIAEVYKLAIDCKIADSSLNPDIVERLYPLDAISSICLTLAIQRYGQNERSLFSFLTSKGEGSFGDFKPSDGVCYNVAKVYDYIKYNFYSALAETNSDSMGWRAITVALERIQNSDCEPEFIESASLIIKTIGMLNLFFSAIRLSKEDLTTYASAALGILNADEIIEKLTRLKLIRYANYKSQYILFEGTNLDIEAELFKASSVVPKPALTADEIAKYVSVKIMIANAHYYNTGTPRYFKFDVLNETITNNDYSSFDGYIHLIFPIGCSLQQTVIASKNSGANIFAYFTNTDEIQAYLHEIKKIKYVTQNVAIDDMVATKELQNQLDFISKKLNRSVNEQLTAENGPVYWIYGGEIRPVASLKELNGLISDVCEDVYSLTPIIKNELFNKPKLSSAISLARVNLLNAMLNESDKEDFGFKPDSFPPEKTIYYCLFKESGMHRQDEFGNWILGAPIAPGLQSLWNACAAFVRSATDKPLKLSLLAEILKKAPYGLKQGVVDFWIPIFLYVNQQDLALYNGSTFVLNINKEVIELIQKRMKDFSVKAYEVEGVKLEFFKRYRQFLKKDDSIAVSSGSLIETVKPFFRFYRTLNNYAKHTRKFDSKFTADFRDVLAHAQDPAKTFFEDLPSAFGYRDLNSEEFAAQYLSLIRTAVQELNSCYDFFIDRLERRIIEHLGLPEEFSEYKRVIESRFSSVDGSILPHKSKAFLERVLAPSNTKREFFEKIGIVITDKRLDETTDSEEPLLISQMLYLFSELDRHSTLSADNENSENVEAFNFELVTNKGKFSRSQTYRLPATKKSMAENIGKEMEKHLTGDTDTDICILLKLLNERIK